MSAGSSEGLRDELPAGLVQLGSGHRRPGGRLSALRAALATSAPSGMAACSSRSTSDAPLPAAFGDARRFATGDARGLSNAQQLNLLHPLVQAAIAEARAWPGGAVALALPHGRQRRPAGAARQDRRAGGCARRLRGLRAGSTPGRRSGRRRCHPRSAAGRAGSRGFRRSTPNRCRPPSTRPGWTMRWRKRCSSISATSNGASRSTSSRPWVSSNGSSTTRCWSAAASVRVSRTGCGRRGLVATRWSAPPRATASKRSSSASPSETRCSSAAFSALDSREDEVYRKWRNEYHELRYRAPVVTRLFQVTFRIVPSSAATSC